MLNQCRECGRVWHIKPNETDCVACGHPINVEPVSEEPEMVDIIEEPIGVAGEEPIGGSVEETKENIDITK